jgi:dynein light chain 1
MPTSCKEAIKRWEAATGQNPAEATEVKLICLIPSISNMDDSLSVFEKVEKLSLSTNTIERI